MLINQAMTNETKPATSFQTSNCKVSGEVREANCTNNQMRAGWKSIII